MYGQYHHPSRHPSADPPVVHLVRVRRVCRVGGGSPEEY